MNNTPPSKIPSSKIPSSKIPSKIPKIIHQIWIGPKKRPSQWMETWKMKNPSWQYKLWTEKTIKKEFPNGLYNQTQYNRLGSQYHGKADILRYEILYKYGGFYIDADTSATRPLDDDLLECDLFTCGLNLENKRYANGFIACKEKSPVMKAMMDEIHEIENINEKACWMMTGPMLFTKIVDRYIKENNLKINIHPYYYFIPNHFRIDNGYNGDKSYCDHHWGTTKKLYEKNGNTNKMNVKRRTKSKVDKDIIKNKLQ